MKVETFPISDLALLWVYVLVLLEELSIDNKFLIYDYIHCLFRQLFLLCPVMCTCFSIFIRYFVDLNVFHVLH